jgi:signal transduction histidine kinase
MDTRRGHPDEAVSLDVLAATLAEELMLQGCRELEAALMHKLAHIGRVTPADRCLLVQTRGVDPDHYTLLEWHAEGLDPLSSPENDNAQLFPWLAEKMRRKEVVRVASVAARPTVEPEGAAELERLGLVSVLALPMWRDNLLQGWLALATTSRETAWDEASVQALERIAAVLAGALEHHRATRELAKRNQMLERFGNRLWQLHRVQTQSYRDPASLLQAYLEAGCSIFNLSTGIVSRIEGTSYTVQALTTDLPGLSEGMVFETSDTYCAEVVRTGRTIAYHHVAALPDMTGHPVYVALGLEAYISTPISVRGALYGTLNFSSTQPRAAPFTLQDRELLELMAESIARFVELRDTEEERDRLVRDSRAAEEERRELLQRTEALSSLAVLAAGVAHEINNPLQGMLSHLRALDSCLSDSPEGRASMEMVEQGILSIAEIVRKLLSLSAEQDQYHERAHCAEAVGYVARLLAPQFARSKINIQNDVPEDETALALEQRELIQILTNLFLNARDAMPEGGEIRLASERQERFTELRVSDTGTGIDPSLRARIFTPFFTTKGRRGTGLGLSVAESIVRKYGGAVEVTSSPGQGTEFLLRLPHHVEPA